MWLSWKYTYSISSTLYQFSQWFTLRSNLTRIYFKSGKYLNFRQHLISFLLFCLYQRTILYPISELTWVNLNYALCGHPKDPFFKKIGKYYLILSEFYLMVGSYFIKALLSVILHVFSGSLIKSMISDSQQRLIQDEKKHLKK